MHLFVKTEIGQGFKKLEDNGNYCADNNSNINNMNRNSNDSCIDLQSERS